MNEMTHDETVAVDEPSQIDRPFQPKTANEIAVAPGGGGVLIQSMPQMVEAAKLMARSGICVPPHCRDNPGVCFAVLYKTNALNLKDPFFVAEHTYPVAQRKKVGNQWMDIETLAFDSTIFHAAVEVSGVLRGPLRCEYAGDGDERTCTVYGTFKGETTPHAHTTPPLKVCHPGHREKDGQKFVKGSPLWDKNPDQQLFYFGVRDWTRKYAPHVVGGIYDKDEFEDMPIGPENAKEITPNLMDRLPGRVDGAPGFDPSVVKNGAAEAGHVPAETGKPKRRRKP